MNTLYKFKENKRREKAITERMYSLYKIQIIKTKKKVKIISEETERNQRKKKSNSFSLGNIIYT